MDSKGASWVLNAVLNSVLNEGAPIKGAAFTPAIKFLGAKPGYLFTKGDQGLGYYWDTKKHEGSKAEDGEGINHGAVPANKALTGEELLKQAEEDANVDEIQLLDAKGLKRLGLAFLRKHKENLEQRMKHADQPEKFLDSEVDLDEHIKSLLQVAGSPELYPILVDMGCVPTLLACLTHENTDIAADTLELFMELTGPDSVEDYHEEARALVDAMLEANALELLVQRLISLDEKVEDEAKAVFNCLVTFQHMVEVEPLVAESLVDKTRLLKWLLTRIRPREFDSIKQEASELLAILVQGNERIQRRLGETGSIDTLLQCVAMYKSRDPATAEEEEFMQNCFDLLCSCMMVPENKAHFVKSEGIELVWIMLQSKKQSRYGAVKLLDFATTRFAQPCDKLVDLGGLKHLFGIFMGKAKIKGPRGGRDVEKEVEERAVSIVFNLMQNQGPKGGRRDRVAAKFVESEFEKCDRLMELYFRYAARVAAQEAKLAARELDEEEEEEEEVDPDELMMARMDAGLFTLQQCAIIVAHLWATGDVGLRKRVLMLLHQKGQALASIKDVLVEYYNNIGMEGGPEEQQRLRLKVKDLLAGMGMALEELQEEPEGPAGDDVRNGRAKPADADAPPPLPTDMKPPPPPLPGAGKGAGAASAHRPEEGLKKQVEADDMDMDMDVEDRYDAPPKLKDVSHRGSEDRSMEQRDKPHSKDKEKQRVQDRDKDKERDRGHEKDRERERPKADRGGREEKEERKRVRSRSREPRDRDREKERPRHQDRDRVDAPRDKEDDREPRRERRRSRSR